MLECKSEETVSDLIDGRSPVPEHFKLLTLKSLGKISVRLENRCGHLSLFDVISLGTSGRLRIPSYGLTTESELVTLLKKQLGNFLDKSIVAALGYGVCEYDRNNDLPRYKLLKETPDINKFIDSSIIESLLKRISEQDRSITIKHLSLSLGLEWPVTGKSANLTVGDFIGLLEHRGFRQKSEISFGKIKRRVAFLCVCALAEGIDELSSDFTGDPLAHPALAKINQRERIILQHRLTEYPAMTLECIGNKFSITRERIRQEEISLLKKIANSSLKILLDKISKDFALELANPENGIRYLLHQDLDVFYRSIKKAQLLAIFATGVGGIADWLTNNFLKIGSGYFLGSPEEWKYIVQHLAQLTPNSNAFSVDQISKEYSLSKSILIAYIKLTRVGAVVGDFVVPRGDGKALAARAIHWYKLVRDSDKTCMTFDDLFIRYNLSSGEARLVKDSISNCPTLFACSSSIFCCLGLNHIQTSSSNADCFGDEAVSYDSLVTEDNLINKIYSYVESKWPVEGGANGCKKFREHPEFCNIPTGSFQACLSKDYRICRLSPGLFAPISFKSADKLYEKMERSYKIALDETTVKAYLFARRSVVNCELLFPLWNNRFEAEVVKMLSRRNDEDPLWESCASVCSGNELIDKASALKLTARRSTAEFRLTPSWMMLRSFAVPDFSAALAVAAHAIVTGSVSWIEANQLLGASQVNEERGVNCIILLSALGILSPIKHWWGPVETSSTAQEIFDYLAKIQHCNGHVRWKTQDIWDRLASRTPSEIGVKGATYNGIINSCGVI
jgi:hypothetical protein